MHYFYPEATAYLSPWILRLFGKRIVYTVHLADDQWLGPTRSVHHRIKQFSLRAAHAIVVLSSQQRGVFAEAFPHKQVSFVPHGFTFSDAEPPLERFEARTRGQRRLVLVGSNYRDFDMLEDILAQRGTRNVRIELIGMDDAARERFAQQPGVVCHPRLTAENYGRVLRESFALLLPLTFATANNALLEAYNAYLPAFLTRIDGVTDYVVDGDRSLFSSPEVLVEVRRAGRGQPVAAPRLLHRGARRRTRPVFLAEGARRTRRGVWRRVSRHTPVSWPAYATCRKCRRIPAVRF